MSKVNNPPELLGEQEFLEWRHHPATRAVLAALEQQVERAKEDWAKGSYTSSDPNVTQRSNVEVTTRIDVLRGLINLTYEDYKETFND